MIKPEWHFMLNEKYEKQETNNRPTSKKARKSVGELYIMIHHLNDALILINKKEENV